MLLRINLCIVALGLCIQANASGEAELESSIIMSGLITSAPTIMVVGSTDLSHERREVIIAAEPDAYSYLGGLDQEPSMTLDAAFEILAATTEADFSEEEMAILVIRSANQMASEGLFGNY